MNTNAPLNDPSDSEDNSILLIFVKERMGIQLKEERNQHME